MSVPYAFAVINIVKNTSPLIPCGNSVPEIRVTSVMFTGTRDDALRKAEHQLTCAGYEILRHECVKEVSESEAKEIRANGFIVWQLNERKE
ncbi:hypothetical protein [Enterobacter sp. PTB]|uniref:hypothetical protein n=1 Tax=Enterobacter sp. PTB TaxID=3143437 RepID=UPI003DA84B54